MTGLGIWKQTSNEEVEGSSVAFYTSKHAYDVGVTSAGELRYIYTTQYDEANGDRFSPNGTLLYHESMTISDIGELVFPGNNGSDLKHAKDATEAELQQALLDMFKQILIDEVDDALGTE